MTIYKCKTCGTRRISRSDLNNLIEMRKADPTYRPIYKLVIDLCRDCEYIEMDKAPQDIQEAFK